MFRSLVLGLMFVGTVAHAAEMRLFTVGSGNVGGGYYAATEAICETVNRAEHGLLRCSPEATPGSLYNLTALRDGQLDFALVQSDWQRIAYEGGLGFAAKGPMTELRSVMSLYPEVVTVLASKDSGIRTLADIVGKRVDIGLPASGRHATVLRLIESMGLGPTDFAALLELPNGAAIDELCTGRIDATVLILGHPNAAIRGALAGCGASLIPVAGPLIDPVLADSPDYLRTTIPSGTYPTLTVDVPSFAVTATLVTRADMDPEIVEALVKDTIEGLPVLRNRAPVLSGLDPATMPTRGLSAPLHPAAAAAYAAPPATQ